MHKTNCCKVLKIFQYGKYLVAYVLKARDFNASSLSTYDFSTHYTSLPHNLIKDKLIGPIA